MKHFWGLHDVRGRFDRFDGSYTVGQAGAQIELTIDAASVDTGNAARDRHLQAHDFFDVEEHPLLQFRSTRLVATGTGRVHLFGTLFAAGTSVPVAFDASVRLIEGDLELEATTTVDQSRLGMNRGPLRNIRRPAKLRVKGAPGTRSARMSERAVGSGDFVQVPPPLLERPWRHGLLLRVAAGGGVVAPLRRLSLADERF